MCSDEFKRSFLWKQIKTIHLKTSKSLRPPTTYYMQLVVCTCHDGNKISLQTCLLFFQIMTTECCFLIVIVGHCKIWTICDGNNHCTKKSTPPSCNYGFEYPCQQAKCTFPIRAPVIGGLFRNPICRAGGRVLTSVPKIFYSSILQSKVS